MNHNRPHRYYPDNQLGNFNWTTALTNPDEVIDKYKDIAIKEGTRLGILLVVGLVILNAVTTDWAVSRRLRR